jgi:hypothetical protein
MKGVKILHFFYKETWPEDYENMIPLIEDKLSSYIPKFLEEHHKGYYEVEFVEIKEEKFVFPPAGIHGLE